MRTYQANIAPKDTRHKRQDRPLQGHNGRHRAKAKSMMDRENSPFDPMVADYYRSFEEQHKHTRPQVGQLPDDYITEGYGLPKDGQVQFKTDNPFLDKYAAQFHANNKNLKATVNQMPEPDFASQAVQSKKSQTSGSTISTDKETNSPNGLPSEVKSNMETSMDEDFSDVKIHKDSKQASNLGALALAQGNNVHFAPGQFKPETQKGKELIGHELAHVKQQRQGRVKPTKLLAKAGTHPHPHPSSHSTMPINDDPALEKEADEMGVKAARAEVATGGEVAAENPTVLQGKMVVQRQTASATGERTIGIGGRNDLQDVKDIQQMLVKIDLLSREGQGADQKAMAACGGISADDGSIGHTISAIKAFQGTYLKDLGYCTYGQVAYRGITHQKLVEAVKEKEKLRAEARQDEGILTKIWKDPKTFMKNAAKAFKQGISNFAENIGANAMEGVSNWISGELKLSLPKSFNAKGVAMLFFDAAKDKFVNILRSTIGSENYERAVKTTGYVKTAVTQGPAALWSELAGDVKASTEGAKETVFESIRSFIVEKVIKQAAGKVASLFNPAGWIWTVISTAYTTLKFIYNELERLKKLYNGFLASIKNIANGNIGGAVGKIVGTLKSFLALGIKFAARFLGLDGIPKRIRETLNKLVSKIKEFFQKIADWIKGKLGFGKGSKGDTRTYKEKERDLKLAIQEAEPHVKNPDLDYKETEAKFPDIVDRRNMKALYLKVVDKRENQVKVHAHGEINPELDTGDAWKDMGDTPRPPELVGKPTPKLDKLAERDPTAPARYVYDFLNVYEGPKYTVPSDILPYVEHRAARKLGMSGEADSLAAYKAASGNHNIAKRNIIVYESDEPGAEKRLRVPDIYEEGNVVGDVKDVNYISLDKQMQDNVKIMEGKAKYLSSQDFITNPPSTFDLVVRASNDSQPKGTKVSENLKKVIKKSGGEIYELIQ